MDQTSKEIATSFATLLSRIPEGMRERLLLTGGGAAYLYGSDRPFSHDMDFMIPMNRTKELHEVLGLEFKVYAGKPVFHSLKAVFEENGQSYDLIARSVIEPDETDISCAFELTPEIDGKKSVLSVDGQTLHLIPKELLVLIKLLAGRSQELGKYDLYDARMILEKNADFDYEFFKKLILESYQPLEDVLSVLMAHAGKVGNIRLLEALESLQQSD